MVHHRGVRYLCGLHGILLGNLQQVVEVPIHIGEHRILGRLDHMEMEVVGCLDNGLVVLALAVDGFEHLVDRLVHQPDVLVRPAFGRVVGSRGLQENPHFEQIFNGFHGDVRGEIRLGVEELDIHLLNRHPIRRVGDDADILQNAKRLPHRHSADPKPGRKLPL